MKYMIKIATVYALLSVAGVYFAQETVAPPPPGGFPEGYVRPNIYDNPPAAPDPTPWYFFGLSIEQQQQRLRLNELEFQQRMRQVHPQR